MSHQHHSTSRSAPPVITLYDVPGHTPHAWAPNIWRIRFILNYKRLRYRTQWVEFQNVEETLQRLGAPPSGQRDGRPIYSLPVLLDPTRDPRNPKVISNPNLIAEYLESYYPARPVFPDGSRALQTLFVHYVQEVFAKPLLPIMVPLSLHQMPERIKSHFQPGPGAAAPTLSGAQREYAWKTVKEQFDFLAAILDKNAGDNEGDGVVAMGSELSYADFAVCSILIWIERLAPHDGWSRVRTWNNGRWHRLWERCREYMDEL